MPTRVPAALPLVSFVAGLALAPVLVSPRFAIAGLITLALLHRRVTVLALFCAAGLALTPRAPELPVIDPDRFAVVEAPLDRDWSERDGSFVLRAPRFRANGHEVDTPISIYTRFEPAEITMEKSLRAEGFVRLNDRGQFTMSIKAPQLLAYEGRLSPFAPASWNRMLANRLERHAAEHPAEVALAQALLLGRGERLTEEMRASFRRGGTYHLLVFSGLQIALAAALLGALLRWMHAPRASDWLLLAFAVVAPLFIGPTPSVSRASLGIGLYAISRIVKRPTSVENLWCVAALLRLMIEPRDLTDASFHLTYAGAGALLFLGRNAPGLPFGAPRPKVGRRPTLHGAAQFRRFVGVPTIIKLLTIEIAIAPLTLFHFHQYALGGSVLTVAMSPLIFAMLIASAVACAFPHAFVFAVIGALHRLCTIFNAYGFSGAFAAPPLAFMIVGGFAALLALALVRSSARAGLIALSLLIPTAAAIARSALAGQVQYPRITFLDVGQGDAILIRSAARTILVDGGMDARIVPLLADRGIRRIDVAVLTHAHPDHCGGLVPVFEQLDVRKLWISPHRFRGPCATRLLAMRPPIHLVRDGDTIAIDGIRIMAMVEDRNFRRAPENNASIVLRVESRQRRILLTGDIEAEAEIALSDRDLRADVIKVAHHGSRSSTRPRFLEAVQPRLAVISCGRRNLFGHPHPAVLDELETRRIRTWRTDHSGSIDVEIRGGHLYVTSRKD